jgi:hypothetical protein
MRAAQDDCVEQTMHDDARRFIQGICYRHLAGMLAALDSALVRAAASPPSGEARGPVHEGTIFGFMRFLMATRDYLLSEGRLRPKGMDDEEFGLLRPLCEQLVSTGRFPPQRLAIFGGPEVARPLVAGYREPFGTARGG